MKESPFFNKMCDELVEYGIRHDQEVLDGIQWLDTQARKDGVSFYEKVYEVLVKHEAREKAKEWLKSKHITQESKGD